VFRCHNKSSRLPVTITYIYYMSKDGYVILLVKIVVRLYIKEDKRHYLQLQFIKV